jgi:hypothetical protein
MIYPKWRAEKIHMRNSSKNKSQSVLASTSLITLSDCLRKRVSHIRIWLIFILETVSSRIESHPLSGPRNIQYPDQ